jgi:propanediol dehydratase small subunit
VTFDAKRDYPLGTSRPELVRTPSGRPLAEVTLEALRAGELEAEDVRAAPETLALQAEVARAAGRPALAGSLERAAELAQVPRETILELYTALRPHRATHAELGAWAERLEAEFGAARTAALVREAAAVYERRGLLASAHERVAGGSQ